jgi:hypothetical protein
MAVIRSLQIAEAMRAGVVWILCFIASKTSTENRCVSRTVFILGAGASKEGGAPIMCDFLDRARDIWALGRVSDANEDFERVFKAISALKVVHSNSRLDLSNIETVFAACEMAKTLRKFPGLADGAEQEVDKILYSLKKLIVRTLQMTLPFRLSKSSGNDDWDLGSPPPYDEFVLLVRQLIDKARPPHDVAVITFNYDAAVDLALVRGGCPVIYGLNGDPAITAPRKVPLLKLHGSISWGFSEQNGTKTVTPLRLGNLLSRANFVFTRTGPFHWPFSTALKNAGMTDEPVLVPPTWNKADSHRALEKVWSLAAHELSEAENIIVIGYSMPETDSFFRHLYALGTVGGTMLRRFWVFNPNPSIERRFHDLLGPGAEGRFEFNPRGHQTFTDAIAYLRSVFPPGN